MRTIPVHYRSCILQIFRASRSLGLGAFVAVVSVTMPAYGQPSASPATADADTSKPAVSDSGASKPAPADADASKPAVTDAGTSKPAVTDGPLAMPSFTRLEEPDIAEKVGLSEAQRKQVADLMAARQQALAGVDQAQRAQTEAQFEKQLRETLTAEQLTRWTELWRHGGAEKKLRFNFRFQPWVDVLNWFAQQADLSLVLDAPPPGTFNYTDSHAYTVPEAIDLLNGVLLTKGYTLIRRERMLLVVNLEDGLPLDLIPRVGLDELDRRGQFEIVRASLPLSGRNPDEVKTEIEPLVGPHGKIDVLPKTGQVLVTDAAARIRAIRAVIESMPMPKPSEKPKPKKEPEKPTLATYAAGSVDPGAAIETFKALLPDAKVVFDAKTEHFIVYAVPSQQASFKQALEQLQAERPPEKRPELKTYPVRADEVEKLLEVVRMLAPEAQTTFDAASSRLVAFATVRQQQAIEKAVEKLESSTVLQGDVELAVYTLKHASPATLQTALSSMFPNVRISVDPGVGRLLVAAKAAEQQAIKSIIESLDTPKQDARQLKIYPLKPKSSATLTTLLATLVPGAQITADVKNRRLVAIAEPAEQAKIQATIEQLAAASVDEQKPVLHVYTIKPPLRRRLLEVLGVLSADMEGMRTITPEADSNELTVWATPTQHEIIAGLIEQLGAEKAEGEPPRLTAYPIRYADPQGVLSVLQTLLPHLHFILDATTSRIAVRARPDDQETIRATIEQLDVKLPEERRLKLMLHPLKDASAATVLSVLSTLLPSVRITQDTDLKSLVVWASGDDQQVVQEAIERLQPSVDPENRPTMKVYTVRDADPRAVAQILQTVAPDVRVSADPSSGKLAAWATPKQHELIRTTVEGMKRALNPEDQRKLSVYHLERADPNSALDILRGIVPEARLTIDQTAGNLVAWAKDREQAAIRQTIDEMESAAEGKGGRTIAVYPLEQNVASSIISVIQPGVPRATFTYDSSNRSLIAWANAHDQALIKQAVERLESGVAGKNPQTLAVYPLKHNMASNVISVLQASVPKARLTYDSTNTNLLAFGTEQEHAKIAQAVEAMEREIGQSSRRTAVMYPLKHADPSTVLSLLQTALPKARIVADNKSKSLVVWASPEEHETIKSSLASLDEELPDSAKKTTEVYRFRLADPVNIAAALRQMLPGVQVAGDRANRTLIATATADEQKKIAEVAKRIQAQTDQGDGSSLKVYQVREADPVVLQRMLTRAMPGSQFSGDRTTGTLSAWATPAEQEIVATAIEQLEAGLPADRRPQVVAYPLKGVDPANALNLLQGAYAKARFTADTKSNTVLAWATPEEQQSIRQALEAMQSGAAKAEDGLTTKVYRFRTANPISALPALRSLLPGVTMSVDSGTSSIVATARPEQHKQIAEAVAQLEGGGAGNEALQLRAYAVDDADPQSALTVLKDLFATRSEVRLSLDAEHHRIIAWASPRQHATIREALDEMKSAGTAEGRLQVEVYSLDHADPQAVDSVLKDLFRDAPAVRIVPDTTQNKIVVLAEPSQHATIRATIEQMQGADQELDVIPLHVIDALTAESAINRLFGVSQRRRKPSDPIIEADLENQQLVVRASKKDVRAIRQLLAKMGEYGAASVAGQMGQRFRVIPMSEQSAQRAIEELQRIWPQIRHNPIRVVTPSAVVPTMRRKPPQTTPEKNEPPKQPATPPEKNADKAPNAASPEDVPADEASGGDDDPLAAKQTAGTANGGDPQEEADKHGDAKTEKNQQAAESPGQPSETPSPIVVSTGPGGLTIASDDLEALDQFESLLKAFLQRRGSGNRDYTIFQLHNANAAIVASTLQKLFEGSSPLRGSFSSVSIVPDPRLNALIVQASRNDLAAIENLIKSLDTSDVPETLVASKPTLIPLKNAIADEVADVLRDVYREQMRTNRSSKIPVPRGVSRDLASVLDSLNANAAGPDLSVGVDQDSNSLVVSAAPPLLEEVQRLVKSLDEAADRLTRTVRVISLKKTNAQGVEDALRVLLPDNRGRRRRSSNRRRR